MTTISGITSSISSIWSYSRPEQAAELEVQQAGIGAGILLLVALISTGCSWIVSAMPQAGRGDGGGSDADFDRDTVVDGDVVDGDTDGEVDGDVDADVSVCSTMGRIGPDVRITDATDVSETSSLVWTGNEYGVSWIDSRDGNEEIYFRRISETGVLVDSDVRITDDSDRSLGPSLVWTGNEYGVSWQDGRDGNSEIYFARIGCVE